MHDEDRLKLYIYSCIFSFFFFFFHCSIIFKLPSLYTVEGCIFYSFIFFYIYFVEKSTGNVRTEYYPSFDKFGCSKRLAGTHLHPFFPTSISIIFFFIILPFYIESTNERSTVANWPDLDESPPPYTRNNANNLSIVVPVFVNK